MKLPDYNTSKLWADLREKMGVTEIRQVSSTKYDKINEEEFIKLGTTGIEVQTLDDIIQPKDGTFEYKGQKIIKTRKKHIQVRRNVIREKIYIS